ncbi:MAG: threonylcarbamoyl-AMP synthase [Treponema sp.]|jgi:L-threonylcarbamoyladenylate synthase|nr:threonylcarbamoyl-AMP synthase [Treponema sp.]
MHILAPSDEGLRKAAEALTAGLLVAFPTETVYGLGGDGFNRHALARIFAAKGRPRFDPLIIHIAALDSLERIAAIASLELTLRNKLDLLCARLWPGPLTLILPKQPEVPDLATSGLPTVAVRFPDHQVAQQLIRLSTGAVAAPSANPFGYLSPTRAEHVQEQLGDQVTFIIDGGPCGIGVESTVLDLTAGSPRILRPGGTPRERIEEIIGAVEGPPVDSVRMFHSPGQLKSHYAPRTGLTLHRREEMILLPYEPSEAYLFFDRSSWDAWVQGPGHPYEVEPGWTETSRIRLLSERGNLDEAATRLFDTLHELDTIGVSVIRAQWVPDAGRGAAINDRLSRAAARTQAS